MRSLSKENLDKKAYLFPIKDALLYVATDPLGLEGTGFQGANLWSAPNPEIGATFSIFIKDEYKTLKSIRQEKEKALEKDKKDVVYPSLEELRKEEQDEKTQLIWIIKDANGNEVRRLISSPSKGISRITWNLRGESTNPINPKATANKNNGFLIQAGTYSVEVVMVTNGKVDQFADKVLFNVKALNNQTLIATDARELNTFRAEVAELNRKVSGSSRLMTESKEKLSILQHALLTYPNTDLKLMEEVHALHLLYDASALELWGDRLKSSKEFETNPSISNRLGLVEYMLTDNTTGVTNSQKANIALVKEEYLTFRIKLDDLIVRLKAIEAKLEKSSVPYIKGKDESWKED